MRLTQRHVTPTKFPGLPRGALREFVQVLEQPGGRVVLGWRPRVDQAFDLAPGGFRVLGQFIEAPLAGRRTLLLPEGLLRGLDGRFLPFALLAAFRRGVEKLGHRPPGT